jgi:hypothetical protein
MSLTNLTESTLLILYVFVYRIHYSVLLGYSEESRPLDSGR